TASYRRWFTPAGRANDSQPVLGAGFTAISHVYHFCCPAARNDPRAARRTDTGAFMLLDAMTRRVSDQGRLPGQRPGTTALNCDHAPGTAMQYLNYGGPHTSGRRQMCTSEPVQGPLESS